MYIGIYIRCIHNFIEVQKKGKFINIENETTLTTLNATHHRQMAIPNVVATTLLLHFPKIWLIFAAVTGKILPL